MLFQSAPPPFSPTLTPHAEQLAAKCIPGSKANETDNHNTISRKDILVNVVNRDNTGYGRDVALLADAVMVLLIYLDTRLHTPMYFLLSQLSLMDLMLICTTVPKVACNYLSGRKSISVAGCEAQIFFYVPLFGAEGFLFAVMAYDHYVAICYPLQYPNLMNWKVCGLMAASSWILGVSDGIVDFYLFLNGKTNACSQICQMRIIDPHTFKFSSFLHTSSFSKKMFRCGKFVASNAEPENCYFSKTYPVSLNAKKFIGGHIEEYLGFTSCYRNGLPAREVVAGHLGYSGADEHEVHEGELAEEEVHGGVEPGVQVDEENHDSVCQERHCKEAQDQREQKDMSGHVTKNSHQGYFNYL
eukprot:bmy_12230T0